MAIPPANLDARKRPLIGVFGGTFNPIHCGHLALADSVLHTLQCTQIRFIPAALPPHKRFPQVSAEHRAAMVALAIAHQPAFVLDRCELARSGLSFTIDTLRTLKSQLPSATLCLIIGQDSYQQLNTWHAWQQLTEIAHLLVVHRAGLSGTLTPHPHHAGKLVPITTAASRFAAQANGLVSFIDTAPPQVSSTQLRTLLETQAPIDTQTMVPPTVLHYIQTHQLYQSEASSA